MTIASSKNDPNQTYEVFLTSTKYVDVKKYLICSIWIIFEKVMAISKFVAKCFLAIVGMYCCTLTVKIVMVEMQGTKITGCFIMYCLGLQINA